VKVSDGTRTRDRLDHNQKEGGLLSRKSLCLSQIRPAELS
jgi:hypothetical protein